MEATTHTGGVENNQTAHVLHLYRGDRKAEDRAEEACDLRFGIRDGERPSPEQVRRLYECVGSEEFTHADQTAALGSLWERWNLGSGVESQAFLTAEVRSLEIGDIAMIGEDLYVLTPYEWEKLAIEAEEVVAAIDELADTP